MSITDPLATADRLLAQRRNADAITVVATAARAGNRDAIFRMAFWHIVGDVLQRDLIAARSALRDAASLGHEEAQIMEVALTANGSGAPADWSLARKQLAVAASRSAQAAAVLAILAEMDLDDSGGPTNLPAAEPLTADAAIMRIPRFLTPTECSHVANAATDLLGPSLVVDSRTGRTIPNPIRTSHEAVISPLREDLVIRAINQRIAAASETPVTAGEALTILYYRPGQQFRMHSDALAGTRNQRVKTVLVYLNDDFTGGETVFPDRDVTVRPVAGDALIFTNTLPDGRPDPRARHAGQPVTKGVKWLATRWIRTFPFDVWTGPEAV